MKYFYDQDGNPAATADQTDPPTGWTPMPSMPSAQGVTYIWNKDTHSWTIKDPAVIAAEEISANNTRIIYQLNAIDIKMIRALGENDTARIAQYNAEKAALRTQLK